MPFSRWWNRGESLAGAPRVRGIPVVHEEWLQVAQDVAAAGGRLLALWASDAQKDGCFVDAAYLTEPGVLVVELRVTRGNGGGSSDYPGIASVFPAAERMERAAFDLVGVRSSDPDQRPWLRHVTWQRAHPLAPEYAPGTAARAAPYEFIRVEGEGVHEIPVGPVHAGIIEPGHFRFSVVGEKVLRLEERLGYVHKGIERRFSEMLLHEGHRLAARVSGDSAVAFSWAYCQALEGLAGCPVPRRASWLRALFLELERIQNHLGDLGALGNDAGFAFGLAQFSRLKEKLLRVMADTLGQRYLFDAIEPGGTSRDLSGPAAEALARCVSEVSEEVHVLRDIYDEHAGVRDRFVGTGRLTSELATRLGVIGLAGRASGQALDARVDLPCDPYDELRPKKIVHEDGDVAARVAIRFDELQESCALIARILRELPPGPHTSAVGVAQPGAVGIGLIEGWRGPVFVALEAGPNGTIRRCHPHDPSWQNWPALEHAIIGNIVPDFPLINKSFNLSYSGHDL